MATKSLKLSVSSSFLGPPAPKDRRGYQRSIDTPPVPARRVMSMQVEFTDKQRSQLELIAIYSGKTAAQVLIDTAQFLMNCEANYYPSTRPVRSQQFLPEDELEARFASILRH